MRLQNPLPEVHGGGWPLEKDESSAFTSRPIEFPVVVHSHLRWSFVWQRPQQIHSRLARRHPILFIEEPVFDARRGADELELEGVHPNVWVLRPRLTSEENAKSRVARLLREAANGPLRSRFSRAVHWVYTPMMESQIDDFPAPAAIVYDCMDELSKFAQAPSGLAENEARLLARADIVFAGGFELGAAKARQHPRVQVFGCGVDFDHFQSAGVVPEAEDLAMIPRPRLGYIGVIDERLDYELLRALARKRRDAAIVMVGPVVKVDPAALPREGNIVYLGPREYAELPRYCAGFDACLMPFAMNEASHFINPTKTLEYLASGKPVVSTPVRDVVRQFADVVTIAEASRFPEAVGRVLAGQHPDVRDGIERARLSSWAETVAAMERAVTRTVLSLRCPEPDVVQSREARTSA